MPFKLISCMTLPPATLLTVPIYDFVNEHEQKKIDTEKYYPCCGKSICKGCIYSSVVAGNVKKCPFCNSDRGSKTYEEVAEEIRTRVAVNDAGAICMLARQYSHGHGCFEQDHAKAIDLFNRSANLGFSKAHSSLGYLYHKSGDLKKAKFHCEAAALAGHEEARCNLGVMDANSGNIERAVKHWKIAASAGHYDAMHYLRLSFEEGHVSRESIDSTLTAYNMSLLR
jgi:TPR repeat protein